ncbi:hypothetical protein ACFL6M_03470 [Candidatus Eisenbacteria bacterium]|uniref:Uncharacterized protein n=1 Tax=Eiseniibacteriota bacterium TaxID=2212470 RepID=A0ABV6YJZ3_UNCEI
MRLRMGFIGFTGVLISLLATGTAGAQSRGGLVAVWGDCTSGQCIVPEPNNSFTAIAGVGFSAQPCSRGF